MELVKTKWDDVSIGEYFDIVDISSDDAIDDVDKDVEILSILCDCDVNDIYNLPIGEVSALRSQMMWLSEFSFDKKSRHFKKFVFNGRNIDIELVVDKMTYAQFVDYQMFWKEGVDTADKMANVLGCFLIPKGHKYNDGYDVAEFRNEIKEHLPITIAQSICFFFLQKSMVSYKGMVASLVWTMRWMKMKIWMKKILRMATDKEMEMMEKMKKAISAMDGLQL